MSNQSYNFQYLNELNEEQRQAVLHNEGPMLVIAGPGSGKTKVLTVRILYLIDYYRVQPESILVITFSKKSAVEMRDRFNNISHGRYKRPVVFGTFHAIFFEILRIEKNYNRSCIINESEQHEYLIEAGFRFGADFTDNYNNRTDLLSFISKAKNIGTYIFEAENEYFDNDEMRILYRNIYYEFLKICAEHRKIDFDDMINTCLELFNKNIHILNKWQRYFKYILVDELQDINRNQYNLIRLLGGESANIFGVGDDDQSIYAFRGANPELMKQFLNDYPHIKCIDLRFNYRCGNSIIELADCLIKHNKSRINKPMQICGNESNPGCVEIYEAESSYIQAEFAADKITELVNDNKYNYKDIAVIFRSGHCSKMFEIIAAQKNIPLNTGKQSVNIFKIEELRIIIDYFNIALDRVNRSAFLNIINHPPRHISRESLSDIKCYGFDSIKKYYKANKERLSVVNKLLEDIKYIGILTPYAALTYLLKGVGLLQYFKQNPSNDIRKYNLELKDILEYFEKICREYNTLEGLINYITSINESDNDCDDIAKNHDVQENRVSLITAHASKGLEYKVVFIIGLQEGLFPHNKNLHGESVEEERRLMYVAMTRAKEKLYLLSLGIEHGKQRSRFVDEIMENQSFIASYSSLSRNSSNASATASYSSSSSM